MKSTVTPVRLCMIVFLSLGVGMPAVAQKKTVDFDSLESHIQAESFDPGFVVGDSNYHAILAASDGKIHFGVNTHSPDHASRYYLFDPATETITLGTEIDKALGEDAEKEVSQGKIHTGLFEHKGKVWFATQTAYYEGTLPGTGHEGKLPYGGGHFMSYDTKTGEFTDLGNVMPSECLMTMSMDKKNEILYSLTWPSGLLVSYDTKSKEILCWGAVQGRGEWGHFPFEWDCICRTLAIDPKGKVYGTTMDGKIWHFDRTLERPLRYIEGLDLSRVPRVQSAAEELKGNFQHGWRVIQWNPNTNTFWGIHFMSTTLFEFDPAAGIIRSVAEMRPEPYQGTATNPEKSQLGFTIGPRNTVFYLVHGPAVKIQGRPTLQSNLYLLTYQIDKGKFTDHGPIFTGDRRRVFFAECIAIGLDDHIYTVAWVEVPEGKSGETIQAAPFSPEETVDARYQMLLVRLPKWQTFLD